MGKNTKTGKDGMQPSEPSERPRPAPVLDSVLDGSKRNRPGNRPTPPVFELDPFDDAIPEPLAARPADRAKPRPARRARLTDELIAGLEPGPVQFYVWDTKDKGLGVRIGATGTVAFVLKLRLPGGRSKWLTLEAEKLEDARIEYLERRLDYGKGKPLATRRQDVLWQDVVDRWAEETLKTIRESSAATYRGALKHVREAFRDRPLRTLKYGDLWAFHESMSATPRQANVCVRLMGAIFKSAMFWDYWDPAKDGLTPHQALGLSRWKPYPETKRNEPFSDEELDRLGPALAAMEPKARIQVAAVRLLLLTGKRLREILDLEWDQIDLPSRTIRWKRTKTGAMAAPLNDATLEVLKGLPRMEGCPYVLPMASGKPIRDLSKFWGRLLDLAGIRDHHRHDLRHTFANESSGLNQNIQKSGMLLGHKNIQSTERYAKVPAATKAALEASQAVASSLARKLGGK